MKKPTDNNNLNLNQAYKAAFIQKKKGKQVHNTFL